VPKYRFYYPMQIRYGDLDPQWHVNHARTLTFFEAARIAYVTSLGLFDGKSFIDYESIIVDVHVVYLEPIQPTQKIRVGVRVSRIGTKSLTVEQQIEDEDTGTPLTRAEVIVVAYDYHKNRSKPVSDAWRKAISAFEGIPPGPTP
jgi:acyl-CoA thioester hydrolase